MEKNKTVEEFLDSKPEWRSSLEKLRALLISTGMEETIKWGIPVYTVQDKNVVGIGAFKSYVGIWFYQGVFLKDSKNVLLNAQKGKTKGMRQWRFSSIDDIDDTLILEYLYEAIQNQKDGKEIKPEKNKTLVIPEELKRALLSQDDLQTAFEQLTPFKQKEYAEYITEAKREATKLSRLEKIKPMILEGVGLNDKYR